MDIQTIVPAERSAGQPLAMLRFLLTSSVRCAWRSFKNCIGVLIGRKPHIHPRDLFLWRFILHLTDIRPIRQITCTGLKHEGAGSQAHMIMSAINFARASGLTYVHTPFSLIHHADRPMDEWVAVWEAFFNLGDGETTCIPEEHRPVDYCYNRSSLELCFGWADPRNELSRRFNELIPEFKRKYYQGKKTGIKNEFTVAVHIRRGDVSETFNSHRFTGTDAIAKTVAAAKSILDSRKIAHTLRIYSQGSPTEFAELAALDVDLNLDADPVRTMQEMIEADVLIMAKGCFSNYAGMISDGIKLFDPAALAGSRMPGWWHFSPPDDWLPCHPDGSFDHAAFERQLSCLICAKGAEGQIRTTGSGQVSSIRATNVEGFDGKTRIR